MTAQEIQTLRELVETWRERERKASTEAQYCARRTSLFSIRCEGKADSLNRCADELDAAILAIEQQDREAVDSFRQHGRQAVDQPAPPHREGNATKERFRVIYIDDAKVQGLPGLGHWDDAGAALYDFATDPPTLVATDAMQPEDANFTRDLAWVPELLNELNRPSPLSAPSEPRQDLPAPPCGHGWHWGATCDEAVKPEVGPMRDTESPSGVQTLGSSGPSLSAPSEPQKPTLLRCADDVQREMVRYCAGLDQWDKMPVIVEGWLRVFEQLQSALEQQGPSEPQERATDELLGVLRDIVGIRHLPHVHGAVGKCTEMALLAQSAIAKFATLEQQGPRQTWTYTREDYEKAADGEDNWYVKDLLDEAAKHAPSALSPPQEERTTE
jgi:hypothetical protein